MESDTLFKNTGRNYWLEQLTPISVIWVLLLLAGTVFAARQYHQIMDSYELGILISTGIVFSFLGLSWRPIQGLIIIVSLLSLCSISFYGTNLEAAEQNFFLRFLLSSQSAIMWMSALYVMATVTYLGNLLSGSSFTGKVATALTWSAIVMGLTGLLVRWRESYLMSPDIGHIPVSNLYEVFILFCLITGLVYLYYENKFRTRSMGAFVLLVISAAVGFLLWYTFSKGAHEIQPLVPALQSYWMKIHVPANFIGYGCFSLAAML
jgi:cytochrome c assembly protein